MKKIVHIVFGHSARGTLRYFFSSNENQLDGEVLGLMDDYSIGPIYQIDTEEGLGKRIEWILKILSEVCFYDDYPVEAVQRDFKGYENIRNIPEDSKVVIWHGENTSDQTGLRFLMSILKNQELYEINVSESSIKNNYGHEYILVSLAQCSPESIHMLIPKIKKMETFKRSNLISEWEALRNTKDTLRILKSNSIMGVDESYYDDALLSNCTNEFKTAPRVIGAVMGESEQFVGDTYLDYRVRKLIENGCLEYRGILTAMRFFEIRLKE